MPEVLAHRNWKLERIGAVGRRLGVPAWQAHFSSTLEYLEILRWLRGFKKAPARTFLVHGEPSAMETLSARIHTELGWTAYAPAYAEKVDLD